MHRLSLFVGRVSTKLEISRIAHETDMQYRMKAILFTLVRAFDFELAVPKEDIVKKRGLVIRPLVLSEPEAGNQMPLIVRQHKA